MKMNNNLKYLNLSKLKFMLKLINQGHDLKARNQKWIIKLFSI